MSVFYSAMEASVDELFQVDEQSSSLIVRIGQRHADEILYARCREQISRLMNEYGFEKIVFDLSEFLVVPSSVLGLIVAVSHGKATVRVINPSESAREDFQLTGLDRLIHVEPRRNPAPK